VRAARSTPLPCCASPGISAAVARPAPRAYDGAVGRLWTAALDLLYPPVCCGCGSPTEGPGFCQGCRVRITLVRPPLCPVCGVPFPTPTASDHACSRCLVHPPRYDRARACAVYDTTRSTPDPLKSALQRFKYDRDVSLAPVLADLMAAHAPLLADDYDVVMPVPLHKQRLRWRGFNQALLLARPLVGRVRVDPFTLRRQRATASQVGLSEADRQRNVRDAFTVDRPERVARRSILLVDDVYTTGATADACAGALLDAGASRVDVLVLARAIR